MRKKVLYDIQASMACTNEFDLRMRKWKRWKMHSIEIQKIYKLIALTRQRIINNAQMRNVYISSSSSKECTIHTRPSEGKFRWKGRYSKNQKACSWSREKLMIKIFNLQQENNAQSASAQCVPKLKSHQQSVFNHNIRIYLSIARFHSETKTFS